MLETGDYTRILQRKRDRPTDGAGEAAAPGVAGHLPAELHNLRTDGLPRKQGHGTPQGGGF